MYFHALETLRDYEDFDQKEITTYDEILKFIYENHKETRFHPRVYKYLDIQLDEERWLHFLELLTEKGLLGIKYELSCPRCNGYVLAYPNLQDIPFGKEAHHEDCGRTFIINESHIFITFFFANRWREVIQTPLM